MGLHRFVLELHHGLLLGESSSFRGNRSDTGRTTSAESYPWCHSEALCQWEIHNLNTRPSRCPVLIYRFVQMMSRFVVAGLIAVALAYVLIKRLTRPSLTKIRGPRSSSFFLGTTLILFAPYIVLTLSRKFARAAPTPDRSNRL